MGVWAKGWASGQDLGTAAKGSASNLSCSGICLRSIYVMIGTFNFKMECCLCLTEILPLGQNSLFSAWVLPPPLVPSSGRIQPMVSLRHLPWPALIQPSSCLTHQGDFSKMHVTFCLDSSCSLMWE